MIVILDSNCFWDDVRAQRPKLRSVLDGFERGAFRLVVPEVVFEELDKQFSARSKALFRELSAAFSSRASEVARLGVALPAAPERDDADIAAYRESLRKQLADAGAELPTHPQDLRAAVPWAVSRRKPFDSSGKGFPDATLWISVLEVAAANPDREIVLVSDDRDFAQSKRDVRLADVLAADLIGRGLRGDQVRLVDGIAAFVEELGERLAATRERAETLIAEGTFDEAIERQMYFSELDQRPLRLGVELDNDPHITQWDLERLDLTDAVSLPGGQLQLETTARARVLLNLIIYRADYYLASEAENPLFTVSNADHNRHYVEAESELEIELDLLITTNEDGSESQIDIAEVRLAPLELAARDLVDRRGEFVQQLEAVLLGKGVDEFTPEELIESDLEEVSIEDTYNAGRARIIEVFEESSEGVSVQVEVEVEADVQWVVRAPTPFDAEKFAALSENMESGAPFLQETESRVPLRVDLSAEWNEEAGWHEFGLNTVTLTPPEAKRRAGRPSAAEQVLIDRQLAAAEEQALAEETGPTPE
jgi:PIN domain